MAKIRAFFTQLTQRKVKWLLATILIVTCFFAYDPWRMENTSGDTISVRYWPVAILKYHTWTLNPFKEDFAGVKYAAVVNTKGELLPRGGWGIALFSLPFYAVAHVTHLGGKEWDHVRVHKVSRWNAIFLALISVLLLYHLLCQMVSLPVAFISTALFAFGTWHWSMGPQGLHTQSATVMVHLISLNLLWTISSATKKSKLGHQAAWLGFVHALVWSLRPIDFLLVAPGALVAKNRKVLMYYLFGFSLVIFGFIYVYNEAYNDLLGFYGFVEKSPDVNTWRLGFFRGFAGLLFSPNRGAIAFFPLLFLVPYLWLRFMKPNKKVPADFQTVLAVGGGVYFTTLCFVDYWHGTWGYGPRYLYALMPYIWPAVTLGINEVVKKFTFQKNRIPVWATALLILFGLEGVFVHGLGHYNFDIYVWNGIFRIVDDPAAWSTKQYMIVDTWRAGSNKNRWADPYQRIKDYGF